MSVIDLTLLDGFRVSRDDQENSIPTRKAKYLLAYLAVSRAYTARRDTLALLLKIVMTTVQELYEGGVAQFLTDDATVFYSIRQLLGQQFDRLSRKERAVLFWLAINRDWTNFKTLVRDTLPPASPH